jgi:opacity protein-like surface antigen
MSALQLAIKLSILSSLWAAQLMAQDVRSEPVPAAKGIRSNLAVGVGYSYLNMSRSGNPAVNLHGVDTNAVLDFVPRWGATLDASYVRAGRDPGSGHSSYVLSVLAGPVFVPAQNDNTRFLIRPLVGVSLVDSSVQVDQLYYRGWQSRFSWAIGTGIEHNLSRPFAIRFTVDYLRTKFMSSAGTVQPQNGIRVSANLVFRFARGRETRPVTAREP